jgi:hypothetical protein
MVGEIDMSFAIGFTLTIIMKQLGLLDGGVAHR